MANINTILNQQGDQILPITSTTAVLNPNESTTLETRLQVIEEDITESADKVQNATAGNFAGLDSSGNLTDSLKKASDFATAAQGAKADTAYQKPQTGIPSLDRKSVV